MKGIVKRETPLGWRLFQLHYTADPEKDPTTPNGKEWYAREHKGVTERDWRKEYEIDWHALGGQLVFPEFDRSVHVTEHNFPLDPNYWTVYLGVDPHPRTAHAAVWLAVNKYGDMCVPYSYWPQLLNEEREAHGEARLTITGEDGYAAKFREIAGPPYNLDSYLEVMDSAGKNFDAAAGADFFHMYANAGIHFYPARKNRDGAGWGVISEALRLKPSGAGEKPTLTIWNDDALCGHNRLLIEQLEKLRFREWRGSVPDKDPPAEPQQLDRHLVEALMYILLFVPEFIDQSRRRSSWEPTIPSCAY